MRRLGLTSATALVVASMVGTGILLTSGFIAGSLRSGSHLVFAWVLGGLLALCGALCYAELGAALPRIGGEYAYLRRIFGPDAGFLAGWVSAFAGFAAPIASACYGASAYLAEVFPTVHPTAFAAVLIVVLTAIHMPRVALGARFNDAATVLKVALVLGLIVAGLLATPTASETSGAQTPAGIVSSEFAIALVLVAFAYTGWNASAYMAGEIERPQRLLPLSLLLGTGLVMVLYVLVNVVYLRALSVEEMAGEAAIGHLAATRLLGSGIADVLSIGIVLLLVSTASAFVMTGPRVTAAMADDGELPVVFAQRGAGGSPQVALVIQAVIALVFLFTSAFENLLTYIGLTLTLSSGLAVWGVIRLRRREPDLERPFRVPLYPLTPLLFLAMAAWMAVFSVKDSPWPVLASAGTLVAGLVARRLLSRNCRAGA